MCSGGRHGSRAPRQGLRPRLHDRGRRSARSRCSSSAGRWPRAGPWGWRPGSAWPPRMRPTAASPRSACPRSRTCSWAAAWLGLVGGVFLLWLAWRTVRSEPGPAAAVTERRGGLAGAYLSILGLTMTNPMTILSFGALFAGLGVTGSRRRRVDADHARRVPGLGAWWVVLTCVVGRSCARASTPRVAPDREHRLRRRDRASGRPVHRGSRPGLTSRRRSTMAGLARAREGRARGGTTAAYRSRGRRAYDRCRMKTPTRSTRARAPARQSVDPWSRMQGQSRSAIHDLGRHMPRLFGGAMVLGIGQLAVGIVLREQTLLAAAVLSAGFGLMVIGVGLLLQSGHDQLASTALAAGVFSTGLVAALVIRAPAPRRRCCRSWRW